MVGCGKNQGRAILCAVTVVALLAGCAGGSGRPGPADPVAVSASAPPESANQASPQSPPAASEPSASAEPEPKPHPTFNPDTNPPLGGPGASTRRRRLAQATEGAPSAVSADKPKPKPGAARSRLPEGDFPDPAGSNSGRTRHDAAERATSQASPKPATVHAFRPESRPEPARPTRSGGTFSDGDNAEDAFALLDRAYADATEPAPAATGRASLGGAGAEMARRRSAIRPQTPDLVPDRRAALASTISLPGVAQEEWLRRATRAASGQAGGGIAVERPFAPGELASPDPEVDAHMGRTDRITYLYWTDYHNAVVANAPDKPFSDLSFEGGDWHIWCVGGKAKRTRCRVGIAYMDSQSRKRLPAMTVFFEPDRSGTIVCVGTGEGGGTVTLTVDRTRPYSAQNGSCFDADRSRAILDDLNRGSSFVFTRRVVEEGQHTGWLSPFGMEKAMELMAFMHRRLAEG